MITHNTHYATFEARGRIVGYAVYDIVKSRYFSPRCGWTLKKSKADIFPTRQLIKDIFSESRFFATPVFESDNNLMALRGWGCK